MSLPSVFKHFARSEAEAFVLPEIDADKSVYEEEEDFHLLTEELEEGEATERTIRKEAPSPKTPIDFAQVQADAIVADARRMADAILEESRQKAIREAEEIREIAQQTGKREGMETGRQQALLEAAAQREAQAEVWEAQVQKFLADAADALDRQMDENLNEMRDLAIAIAEKVVSVSLRSSTEIIGRMVQTALDKRKQREWVHIYIAECDIKRMGQVPQSLTSALAALSDRVKIIPMAEDEPGTCVIEMPDEIVDASASTQMQNIRSLLSNRPESAMEPLNFQF